MKSLILSTLIVGGVAMSSGVVAQNVASLYAAQGKHFVFLDKDGLSPTAKNMLRTIATDAAPARTIEVRGAPLYADVVKRQLIEDGISPTAIIVRQGTYRMLPSSGDAISDLQDRSVEIRVGM